MTHVCRQNCRFKSENTRELETLILDLGDRFYSLGQMIWAPPRPSLECPAGPLLLFTLNWGNRVWVRHRSSWIGRVKVHPLGTFL